MRCRILKEGRSHKRWEYILEFDEAFESRNFVGALNDALMGIEPYKDFLLDSENFRHYLVNELTGTQKKYAEFVFAKCTNPREALVCVKRLDLAREDLHNLLEALLGYDFNKPKPSLGRNEQLTLKLD